MSDATNLKTQLQNLFGTTIENVVQQLPSIAAAILILVIGWIAARLIRLLTIRILDLLNRFLERVLTGRTRAVIRFSEGVTRLTAAVLFWITLFIFATTALRIAGLDAFASWLEKMVDYLPAILTGGLIILVGYVLSSLVRDVTEAAAYSAELEQTELISRAAQAVTFVTAIIIGIGQAGVDITFITTMIGVTTAAILAGFALAFGLGARTLVSNLIAAHYLRDLVEPGQRVRMAELEGVVLDVSATNLIINTDDGRVAIPAKLLHEQGMTLLVEDEDDA